MIKQDYLMRMVAQMVEVLVRILRLRETGQYEQGLAAIDDALQKFIGLDARFINSLSVKDLVALMKPSIGLDATRALVAADMLKEQGEIFEARGDLEQTFDSHVKSLTLFLEIFTSPATPDLPERVAKTEELIERLDEWELPPETQARLFHYFEKTGRYSRAEDALFEMIEVGADEETVALGRSFYDRLLLKNDEDLIAGGLPREEIREGLARLLEARTAGD
jgi:hypothetical protein